MRWVFCTGITALSTNIQKFHGLQIDGTEKWKQGEWREGFSKWLLSGPVRELELDIYIVPVPIYPSSYGLTEMLEFCPILAHLTLILHPPPFKKLPWNWIFKLLTCHIGTCVWKAHRFDYMKLQQNKSDGKWKISSFFFKLVYIKNQLNSKKWTCTSAKARVLVFWYHRKVWLLSPLLCHSLTV